MTRPINIKGGAALDWTRDNPGKELFGKPDQSVYRLRFFGASWELRYDPNGEWYSVEHAFRLILSTTWSAPQRELPPTPSGYRWEIDGATGEPIALVSDELPGRAVLRDEHALKESIRFVLLQQALIAEYEGRVKP